MIIIISRYSVISHTAKLTSLLVDFGLHSQEIIYIAYYVILSKFV